MLLIPSLDLRSGRCVRLREGNFAAETTYAASPAEVLRYYTSLGASWLHVVDLDAVRGDYGVNASLIEELARESSVRLQVGGGIRDATTIDYLLSAGIHRVVIGTAAVSHPHEVRRWLKSFGVHRICAALDVRLTHADEPTVHTHGWTVPSTASLWEALKAYPSGLLRHVLCTDIARDGTLQGPNLSLYTQLLERYPGLSWQASGGIRHASDLTALAQLGLTAAVSGRALLEAHIPTAEVTPFLRGV